MKTKRSVVWMVLVLACTALPLAAQVMKEGSDSLSYLSIANDRLVVSRDVAAADEVVGALDKSAGAAWAAFEATLSGQWSAQADRRTGRMEFAEGAGIPWVPGSGNSLAKADIGTHLGAKAEVDLATMESVARAFLPRVAALMGVDPAELVLNHGRSGRPADYLWFVDFDVVRDGLQIEGARVVFRVNHGNLIQMGTENLPSPGARTPLILVEREKALAALERYVGGFASIDTFVDQGSLRLLPVDREDKAFAQGYAPGNGRELMAAWQFIFRREGTVGTWRGRVDATSGEVLDFYDINDYAQALVTGGAYAGDRPTAEAVKAMPFANVSSGGYTNSAGVYNYTSGTVTTTLNGQYVKITDSCGSISKGSDASGNIALGSSTGTDCTTPGSGGAGNTHAARTQFYMVNRAKEGARGWLPTNTWINSQLTANVNLNQTCNAYWNGSSLNFFRSGGGCANTGELPGVSLHEYGHGLDSNDGNGSSTDNGTGETYGDFTAALATHASCIGNGFLSSNCGGYGDACTSCTGVRDIDWAKHSTAAAHTVGNFTQTKCPNPSPTNPNYKGPCGKEGHCESYVSSEALWDLAARDLPSPGSGAAWSITDRLWYLSRSTSTGAFTCVKTTSPWTSNGCSTGSLWKSMRAVDDDDGNLSNGTPHSCNLYAAFNRHGIACTTDAGANTCASTCTPPAVPTLTVTGGTYQVAASWSGSSGVYDLYRNEAGCNAGFVRVANDVATTSYTDTAVANGTTYYYQLVAQPSGNEACAAAPSTCKSVTPSGGTCTPPAAPTGVTASATSQTAANVSWTASSGATSYKIYRSTTSGGPYSQVGTSSTTSFADSGLTCNTAYYYVVTASNGSCDSGNSAQASTTTQACTGNVLTKGVPVTGISGAQGSEQNWTMSVPSGATNLSFQTSGGTGDADLYVKFGSAPTTTSYDCRPYTSGNNETCSFATPSAGTWYVMIRGYTAYSGVSLVGDYTAACTPPAAPTGVSASAVSQTQVNVSWSASSGATSYKIFRSATSGGPYTQVGTSTTTSFSNTGLTCNTAYYYVVTASNGSCDSGNSAQASATTQACSGGCTTTTLYSNNFDAATGMSDWTKGTFVTGGSTTSWRGVQTCTAASGTKIFRYGGSACTYNYASNDFNFAKPKGATGISVPAGSTTSQMTFKHRRRFESGYDGGTLAVSLDGTNYTWVAASALTGATYNGTVAADCPPTGSAGAAIFTGVSTSFSTTTVNLDAVCNAITGGTGGCAGRTLHVAFTSVTDCSVTDDGWFLDDVSVTACTP